MESSAPAPAPGGSSSRAPATTQREPSQAYQGPSSSHNQSQAGGAGGGGGGGKKKKSNHKRRRKRRQSFIPSSQAIPVSEATQSTHDMQQTPRTPFYRVGTGRNLSGSSLDSEALLDHRDQMPMRPRRESRAALGDIGQSYRPTYVNPFGSERPPRQGRKKSGNNPDNDDQDYGNVDDRTPLMGNGSERPASRGFGGGGGGFSYGLFDSQSRNIRSLFRRRSNSRATSSSSQRRPTLARESSGLVYPQSYDINNPPSVPPSPKLGHEGALDDVMVTEPLSGHIPPERRATMATSGEYLIDIDDRDGGGFVASPAGSKTAPPEARRHTLSVPSAEGDVCFPVEGMSELAEEDYQHALERRRKRARQWPDLLILEEWSREEKEGRSEGIRAKKISEPVLVGGRLRPQKHGWHREEEDAPYRFTYFNEELESTIHSQTISELLQPGQSFRELFIPEPPELSESSSEEEDDTRSQSQANHDRLNLSPGLLSGTGTRQSSVVGDDYRTPRESNGFAAQATEGNENRARGQKPKRYGARPTFWLDVLSPTETEMKVIQRAFGIHPLTAEDILMQEAREKVELFRNYYFVNYRTFEQDVNSDDHLEPVNMYVVVFREGVLSFHFSQSPHPANVRRRIRQLKDYLVLTADWISYAIIDDITDVFVPLISSIEREVDDIDDDILQLHQSADPDAKKDGAPSGGGGSNSSKANKMSEKRSEAGENPTSAPESGADMLRRVGQARKKVMGLYRLLGNKADVIKGFAKRCNEQWEVAPRSEIGLYLGDIQDHIITMTANLGHYETLLSRAHSNYLAQINIRMNERQEQTADVLGKLTVLGTIVLPMNIITGMWGMNVLVPGQETDNLYWFWSITAGLVLFGVSCFFIAKRVYGIV